MVREKYRASLKGLSPSYTEASVTDKWRGSVEESDALMRAKSRLNASYHERRTYLVVGADQARYIMVSSDHLVVGILQCLSRSWSTC